jgi:hypothetical protein
MPATTAMLAKRDLTLTSITDELAAELLLAVEDAEDALDDVIEVEDFPLIVPLGLEEVDAAVFVALRTLGKVVESAGNMSKI